jgi:flavodoxin I
MSKIGLFYGPEGGNVEKVTRIIAEKIGADKVDVYKVKDVEIDVLDRYQYLVMGLSTLGKHTWSADHAHNDWDEFLPKLEKADLKGKKLAIYGLGDHIAYADHFVDSIGDLAEVAIATGVELVGKCSTEGYEFKESRAVVDGEFLGLPLDEDFESDLTVKRVNAWLKRIMPEFE